MQGRPIFYEIGGKLDIEEIYKVTSETRLLRFYIKEYEKSVNLIYPACSSASGKYIFNNLSILDIKGESSAFMNTKFLNLVKKTTSTAQNNYPEMLGQILVINANVLFRGAWGLISAFINRYIITII